MADSSQFPHCYSNLATTREAGFFVPKAHQMSHSLSTLATMNTLVDFPPDQFRILGGCEACGHSDWLDRGKTLPDSLTIDALRERVTCQTCGSRDCGIRIVYFGSGGFRYGAGRGAVVRNPE